MFKMFCVIGGVLLTSVIVAVTPTQKYADYVDLFLDEGDALELGHP